jgi:glycosyltransferase involved in cell wall biosynthesis
MKGETILCFAPRRWHSLWRETQYLMSRISRHNRVVYIEPGRLGPEGLRTLNPTITTISDTLVLVSGPLKLPIARRHLSRTLLAVTTPVITEFNNWCWRHVGKSVVKALNIRDPILWLQNPYSYSLIGYFGEKMSCYHNYDEFCDMIGNGSVKDLLWSYEERLVRRVDVVFTTSSAQLEKRKPLNRNAFLLPNGVDFDTFNAPLRSPWPLPADVASLPRPIIGFAGWLGYNIDMELLVRVAAEYPQASLVLIGPDELPRSNMKQQLKALPNVFFLGEKKWEALPGYLQAFNVALMPYSLKGHVRTAYPMKLNEYFSMGLPIVSADLLELYPYRQLLSITTTPEQFVKEVGRALNQPDEHLVAERVSAARKNSWDARVEQIYDVLSRWPSRRAHFSLTA